MGLLDYQDKANKLAQLLQGSYSYTLPANNGLANLISQETGGMGVREDGTQKDLGYFGPMTFDDNRGGVGQSTELSADTTLKNGQNLFYPLISQRQSFKDMSNLLTGGRPSNEMYDTAIKDALSRKLTGRSPFAGLLEQRKYGE